MNLSSYTISILIISTITALIAGLFLVLFKSYLISIPGLIILVPVAMGTRGAIYGSLGAKIASGFHMGLIDSFSFKNKFLREKMVKAFKVNVFASFFISIVIYGLTFVSNTQVNPFFLISLSVLTGIISGIIILFITYIVALASYRRGWNPDNVTVPIIASVGDLFTIPIMLLLSVFLIKSPTIFIIYISVIALIVSIYFLKNIWNITFNIIIIAILIDIIAGFFLDKYLYIILTIPGILIIIPVFLSQGGSIIGIFSSNLSTRLHLGLSNISKKTIQDGINAILLSIGVFSLIVILSYFAGMLLLNISLSISLLLKISIIGGLMLILPSLFLAYMVSIISFKHNIDPDDIAIPIMNSLIDFLGVFFIILTIVIL